MSRITPILQHLQQQQRKALIPYLMAGDPSLPMSLQLMHALVDAGADIIELGAPFSEPVSDGTVIQAAHLRSLQQKTTLHKTLELVRQFREKNTQTPVVLMGYVNPIETMGYKNFIEQAKTVGLDGILTVDLPLEEGRNFFHELETAAMDPIFLIAPTTAEQRMSEILKVARGYIYYISLKGVTGSDKLDITSVAQGIKPVRTLTQLPIAVGFGIHDAQSAAQIATVADGVIVGSALVALIEENQKNPAVMLQKVTEFIMQLRKALDAPQLG